MISNLLLFCSVFLSTKVKLLGLGFLQIKYEAIKPRIPNVGIRVRLRIIPVMNDRIASLRLTSVFPWLLIRFPVLRYPRAVNR